MNDPDNHDQPIPVVSPPSIAVLATQAVVNTQITGDPKVGTQPQSITGPAPKFKTLGRYKVIGELGKGGMGVVYLAEDTTLRRKVALKIPQFEPRKEEQMRARFIQEAQIAAQLNHPNICRIFDVGVIDDQLVMAMEYIDGRGLDSLTKPDKLVSERQAVGLVRKIALAVEVAHRKGLVHRDLKPSNIMLSQPDKTKKTIEPKVMDFGLAKSLDPTGQKLTHSGMIVGTPCYMSKEQWSGKDGNLGPASDVFSLGTILYELLTGKLPFDADEGEPATAWFVKLITRPQILPSERKPGIDPGLEAIVMRSIAKEVENRYATMAEFALALDGWIKGKPTPAGPAGHSLLELPFDLNELTALATEARPTVRRSRKPPSLIPPWLMWAGGGAAAALLLGIVLIFTNSKGETTVVKTDGPNATLTTPEGTISASTSPTTREGTQLPVPTTPPPVKSSVVTTTGGNGSELPTGELIYAISNGGLATRRFDGKTSTSQKAEDRLPITSMNWKTATQSLVVLSQDRLLSFSPNSSKPQEIYRFPEAPAQVAIHPSQSRMVWRRGDQLFQSKLDGTDETHLGIGYDPIWTDDGQRLVYLGWSNSDWAIGVHEGNQTRYLKMSAHPAVCVCPAPSPDGTQIVFAMKGDDGTMQIGLMSIDGRNARQLTRTGDGNSCPRFSPDGRFITFIRSNPLPMSVVIVNVQTREETVIANDATFIPPVWHAVTPVEEKTSVSLSRKLSDEENTKSESVGMGAVSDPHRRFAQWVIQSGGAVALTTGQWCTELALLPPTPFTVAGADLVDLQVIPEPIDAVAGQLNLTWVVSKKNSPEAAITLANKNSSTLKSINFYGPVTNSQLAQLGGSDSVNGITFETSWEYTEEGLKVLKSFPNLSSIWFNVGSINDAGLAHLTGLRKVDTLVLWATAVTDAGLVHLKGMTLLQSLQLGDSRGIAGPGIQHLVGLPKLKYLSVTSTPFGDAGMEYIGKLPAIEELHLSRTKITDAQLHRLDTLSTLKVLHLAGTQVTDAGLAKLVILGSLTELGLAETGLTDVGLANLSRHKNLKRLFVQKTKVTKDAVIAFRKALPNCVIESDFSKVDAIGAVPPPRIATDPAKTGLLAEFFAGPDFDRKTNERIESRINTTLWKWGVDGLVPPGKFSVRWTGSIKAPSTGLYELVTESDDGVRVWIDGKLVIDDWVAHARQTKVGSFRFDDQPHSIKVEFWESYTGEYFLQLKWRKGNGTLDLIPAEVFFQPPDRSAENGAGPTTPSNTSALPPDKINEQPKPTPSTLTATLNGTAAGELSETTLPGDVTLKQVWCPPGTFTMGTPGATDDEAPVSVTLTQGFWMAQTETTQGQWTAVMGAASKPWSGKTSVKEGPNFPASYISHGVKADGTIEADSATAFCEKLTEIERKAGRLPTGWKYALPSEAQWEYACRAGTPTAYSFGDDKTQLGDYAWWGVASGDGNVKKEPYPHAVRTRKQNPWGLYDMHGNVYEWCRDGYAEKLIGGSDPVNISTVGSRVLRGGSWLDFAMGTRSSLRFRNPPYLRNLFIGFRVTRTQ